MSFQLARCQKSGLWGTQRGDGDPPVTTAETLRHRPGGGAAALHKVPNSSAKAESQFWKLRAKLSHLCGITAGAGAGLDSEHSGACQPLWMI